ncbi:MAG: hypothetical protein OXC63_10545 [Aestuariivita sp.]|nr:hypothetical protein [Aestuariivita sp.]MCY4347384.1 hypothetical protein [Aestuariivita sp.]
MLGRNPPSSLADDEATPNTDMSDLLVPRPCLREPIPEIWGAETGSILQTSIGTATFQRFSHPHRHFCATNPGDAFKP